MTFMIIVVDKSVNLYVVVPKHILGVENNTFVTLF